MSSGCRPLFDWGKVTEEILAVKEVGSSIWLPDSTHIFLSVLDQPFWISLMSIWIGLITIYHACVSARVSN